MACIQKKNEKEDDKKDNRTIITIPDELWDEIKVILPREKPLKTVGRPIVRYRKVPDGVLYILRTGCQWKMLPKEYEWVPHAIEGFRNGINWMFSKRHGFDY